MLIKIAGMKGKVRVSLVDAEGRMGIQDILSINQMLPREKKKTECTSRQ